MKVLLISLLILSFLGISVLSFVTMYHTDPYGDSHCVTKTAAGMECPANSFAFADFHLNFFREFSSAYFGNFLNTFLTSIVLLLLGLIFSRFEHKPLNVGSIKHYRFGRFLESFTPLVESKTSYWLSLHENSPTFILRR